MVISLNWWNYITGQRDAAEDGLLSAVYEANKHPECCIDPPDTHDIEFWHNLLQYIFYKWVYLQHKDSEAYFIGDLGVYKAVCQHAALGGPQFIYYSVWIMGENS